MKNNLVRQPAGTPPIKTSVLVPVYNGLRFLPECLDSILSQDCASLEILLADDGSSDGSAALLENYAARDPRIRWWKNRQNLGLAGNWNCLLREARGEYIKFVFQDDKLLSATALGQMAQVMDEHPDVALVASASYIIDERSRILELRDYFRAGVSDGRQMVVRCLEQPANLIGEPSVVMFRRALAQRGFDGQLRHLLDVDMWFHLLEQGQFAHVSEPLCAFRKHAAQQTRVNLVSGAAANDSVILLSRWLSKPWLEKMMTRRMNFALAYDLRRQRNPAEHALSLELQKKMGSGWYVLFWLSRKISRPIKKMERKLKLKIWRLSHPHAIPSFYSAAPVGQIRALERAINASTGPSVVLPGGKIEYLSSSTATVPKPATPVSSQGGEYHLFILWQAARGREAQILDDLKKSFDIVAVHEVRWSAARVSDNFTRFYGQKLPPGSFKEEHCGKGPFLAVIVQDRAPLYEKRQTSKGEHKVNTNTFDAKQRYREWTGGGHRVHATDSEWEARHDFAMLFGMSLAEFITAHPQAWNGKIEIFNSDLAGAEGWADLKQFFAVLNETVRYLVLRNFEWLPDQFRTAEHGDIDLLTDSAGELAFVANARRIFPEPYRIHYAVKIGREEVRFDFRHVGDDYYDPKWENFMLVERQWNGRGFHVPPPEDYFYSLLYHALVHKPKVSADYVEKLERLAADLKLPGVNAATFTQPCKAKRLLDVFLKLKGFEYRRPGDLSVHFNEPLFRAVPAAVIQPEAVRGLPELRHSSTLLSARVLAGHAGVEYYSLVYEDAKTGGILKQTTGDLAWRDAELLRRLEGPHFPRVIEAGQEDGWSVAVFERIAGRELTQVIPEIAATPKTLATFVGECLDILEALQAAGITHRDIHARNILVCDGHPVLIDFSWAIAPDMPCFDPRGLGNDGRPPDGSFCDVFSMGKVFAACAPKNDLLFTPLIAAMTKTNSQRRVKSVPALHSMLSQLDLPAHWPRFSGALAAIFRFFWKI